MAKKLSYEYKIPGRSLPEVHERYVAALAYHGRDRTIKFNGRKLSAEALTNAVVLHFLDLPADEQRKILRDYVARFDAIRQEQKGAALSGEEGSPAGEEDDKGPVVKKMPRAPEIVDVQLPESLRPKKSRKRG